jgi:hypothetical protein
MSTFLPELFGFDATMTFWAELFSPKNDLPLFAHILFSTKNEKNSFLFSLMVSRFTFWKPLSQN